MESLKLSKITLLFCTKISRGMTELCRGPNFTKNSDRKFLISIAGWVHLLSFTTQLIILMLSSKITDNLNDVGLKGVLETMIHLKIK